MFLERCQLLQIMASRLENKGVIRLSSRVTSVHEQENQVTVTSEDGFQVTADLVIGADGVHSCVRHFIDSLRPIVPTRKSIQPMNVSWLIQGEHDEAY